LHAAFTDNIVLIYVNINGKEIFFWHSLIIWVGTFQVLATGLSALYSDLPTSLDIPSEDWYSLERGLWATFPELVSFLRSLEFCNNVIQVQYMFLWG